MTAPGDEDLLRREAPQVLAALVRRYGHFELAEEAVQDALIEAARTWSTDARPTNPRGWLIRVAQRRLVDAMRSEYSRATREERYALTNPVQVMPLAEDLSRDDSVDLLFMCCHPSLTPGSAVALTLRALAGLSTDEIGAAFFVPSTTMGQRISRAKKTIAAAHIHLDIDPADVSKRLSSVLAVLYLMFSEGYTTSAGAQLTRVELSAEAIRLTRMVLQKLPEHTEVAALLALELLHEARRPTRERDGLPTPLDEQDRSQWDTTLIAEGTELIDTAMARGPLGPYQVQAAIAAVHCSTDNAADTDWLQILALYDVLLRVDPSPMALVSRAVALARVHGPDAGLKALDEAARSPLLAHSHRVAAVRGHLLEEQGDRIGAVDAYRRAARATKSQPERRHLLAQAERLAHHDSGAEPLQGAGSRRSHDPG